MACEGTNRKEKSNEGGGGYGASAEGGSWVGVEKRSGCVERFDVEGEEGRSGDFKPPWGMGSTVTERRSVSVLFSSCDESKRLRNSSNEFARDWRRRTDAMTN